LIKKLKRKIFRDERQLPAAADSQGDACGAPDQTVTPCKTFSVLDFFRSMFCFRPMPIRLPRPAREIQDREIRPK
jgi:hypothetical protein